MPRTLLPVLALLLLTGPQFADGAAPGSALEGLVSRAEVAGPSGTFVTEIVSLADGRARFVQTHAPPRGRVELLAVGERAFQRDAGGRFVAAPAGTAAFVRGHDAPRLALARGSRPARLELPQAADAGGGSVTIEISDWRKIIGFELPFAVTFTHSAAPADRYAYRYTALLPFRVAPGSPLLTGESDPGALFERLGDLGELAAAHERVMAAHRASDADAMAADTAEVATISGRGQLTSSELAEFRDRMRGYLGSIRFARYEDTAVPVIALSVDGTLGWLACEMAAEGTRTVEGKSEELAYGFSWVELSAKKADGTWQSIGNASSQRP